MSAIISPSIYIREFFDLRPQVEDGYNVLITGFTSEGLSNDPTILSSISDFVALYGEPDPSRPEQIYAYQGVKDIIEGGANALFVKLPYGAKEGYEVDDSYTALLFPAYEDQEASGEVTVAWTASQNIPPIGTDLGLPFSAGFAEGDEISLEDHQFLIDNGFTTQAGLFTARTEQTECEGYVFGKPTRINLTEEEYEKIKCGQISWGDFTTDFGTEFDPLIFGGAGLIILDEGRSRTYDGKSGYYVTVTDNSDGDPATPYDSISSIETSTDTSGNPTTPTAWETLNTDCYDFKLQSDGVSNTPNLSETLYGMSTSDTNEPWENNLYKSWINVTLWRLREDYSNGFPKLIPNIIESHTGSVSEDATTVSEGGVKVTASLPKVIEGKRSARLCTFINPKITKDVYFDSAGSPIKNIRFLRDSDTVIDGLGTPPLGYEAGGSAYSVSKFTEKSNQSACDVGNIPAKLRNALCTVEDPDRVDIDLSVEAGLGTIWTTVNNDPSSWITGSKEDFSWCYDDSTYLEVEEDLGRLSKTRNYKNTWREIFDEFATFTEVTRLCNGGYHHLHIADTLRQILVNGRDCKVYDQRKKCQNPYLFQEMIYWPSKHLTEGISGSVATKTTIDAQWYQKNNIYTSGTTWVPSSPVVAQLMASTPFPWDASAGFNRGIVNGVLGLALDPIKRDRDLLYQINHNAVYFDKSGGYIRLADKTLLMNDNIQLKHNSTRRALTWLQKELQTSLKPFLFEFNTIQNRVRFKQTIESALNILRTNGAIFDYEVSLKRNTLEAQQDGCLIADIYIKFSGQVEKIILNFNILRLDEPFQEVF